jgi:hypothetical protein
VHELLILGECQVILVNQMTTDGKGATAPCLGRVWERLVKHSILYY